MQTEVVVALVGLAGSGLGSLAGVVASAKLTAYRIEQLEKKVDKHNTVIERTYKLEECILILERRLFGSGFMTVFLIKNIYNQITR